MEGRSEKLFLAHAIINYMKYITQYVLMPHKNIHCFYSPVCAQHLACDLACHDEFLWCSVLGRLHKGKVVTSILTGEYSFNIWNAKGDLVTWGQIASIGIQDLMGSTEASIEVLFFCLISQSSRIITGLLNILFAEALLLQLCWDFSVLDWLLF